MKKILIGLLALVSFTSFAKTFNNELKFYIIKPKHELKWDSPRSLAYTSAINSMGKNYAPIGHFAVEVNCDEPNGRGISHVLTGMERHPSEKGSKIVLKKKLGLGSVLYDWQGDLQSADTAKAVIEKAKKDNRLKTVIIPTTPSRCQSALKFIDAWIENGSYTVYGGNKDAFNGEGSGCADFALVLFHIATSVTPTREIFVEVDIPKNLIGDGKNKKIPFSKILSSGRWAAKGEESVSYVTPETDRTVAYLERNAVAFDQKYLYLRHLESERLKPLVGVDDFIGSLSELLHLVEDQLESLPPYPRENFDFKHKYKLREDADVTWKRISL